MAILASQTKCAWQGFFHVSCITYSSQPCISIPRRAVRLSATYNKAQACSFVAKLAQKAADICMAGGSKEDLASTSPTPAVPFVFSWILKAADSKPCTQRASPWRHYAAASLCLLPGEWLTLACGLRERFCREKQVSGPGPVSVHCSAFSGLFTGVWKS